MGLLRELELELFQVVARATSDRVPRLMDPVCGMELAHDEAAAKLTFDGEEQVFCSQECLRRFVAAPERYRPIASRD